MRNLFLALGLCAGVGCFAQECQVTIPVERLMVSCDGMGMIDEKEGVIELENLHHDNGVFYTVCEVEAVDAEELVLACSPASLSRVIERYLSDPEVAEQFLEELTCRTEVVARGGADHGVGAGKVVIEDKDKKRTVELGGVVSHGNGQTQASGQCEIKQGF